MITELLRAEKILVGLKGDFPQVLEELLQRSSHPDRLAEFRAALVAGNANRYGYIGNDIAIPHVRLEGLAAPEMILGLSPGGMRLEGDAVKIALFFAMPADQTEEHLQILQRLSSLLPTIKEELLAQRNPAGALKIIARGEQQAGKATFINLTQEQVAFELQTDLEQGLKSEEAKRRLDHYGPNILKRARRTPWTLKLLKNFFSFFAILLWIAAVLCFVPGVDMPQLGVAILTVIFINGLFAFFQEQRSDRAIEFLQQLISQKSRVIREGRVAEIDAEVLVPGDLILFEEGDLVPADARLIEAFEVEADNSSLTGESTPARRYKSDRPILIPGKFLWIELPNVVFAGTALVRGRARAVVIGTGMHSEIGKIAGLTQAIRAEDSPLQRELRATVFAIAGLRVLALAYRDDPELQDLTAYPAEQVESRLVFIGLVAMSDPVRPEVPEAIWACHSAGIRVIMITGDYALTALSIGRQIGLGGGEPLKVFSGADILEMGDEQLRGILANGESIFARVAPEHKLRIVSLLKEMGETVAVTGDGVNDAPALKKADIGIAMGVRGNDVAKEAAHMILTDDNFSSIVAAIEEGRAVFENIRRFMAYIFNSNPQEMYPYIFWMLFPNTPLAMTVMGVLAVDVGTDLIPAMGLGMEPPEKGLMERAPRRRDEKLLSLKFILRSYFVQGSLLAFSCYATYLYMGWLAGAFRSGLSLAAMPPSPPGLKLHQASPAYLQTLTAYFFPTVTTQVANVLCKRSSKSSLFAKDFLTPLYRREILEAIACWRPRPYITRIRIEYHISGVTQIQATQAFFALVRSLLLFPLKSLLMVFSKAAVALERPLIVPLTAWAARFLERHYVILNLVSNPLIDLGILFELFLSYLFIHTPLSEIYYFAPVPWHVYLFAFHGTVLLLAFEEAKKYCRRRGHALEFLG